MLWDKASTEGTLPSTAVGAGATLVVGLMAEDSMTGAGETMACSRKRETPRRKSERAVLLAAGELLNLRLRMRSSRSSWKTTASLRSRLLSFMSSIILRG